MTSSDESDVVARYRAVARETPTPAVDAIVLRAASRALRERNARKTWFLAAAAAVAGVGVALVTFTPRSIDRTPLMSDATRGYGQIEGRSRLFLLRESGAADVGPGSTSFIQVDPYVEGEPSP
jgi:hypothetical protein